MSETGVIKFHCEREPGTVPAFEGFEAIQRTRRKLQQLRLLGVGADGIGYGNLSLRVGLTNEFFITGSGTGGLPQLGLEDVARVTAVDFARNWLRCTGGTVASSESLTHAAIYAAAPKVLAILHGHSSALWTRLRDRVPTTSAAVEYGTPAMAAEVQRLFAETEVREHGLFIMGGHEGGLIAFGASLDEALARVLSAP